MFRAKLRTLVCKPPVNCSVTHKPLDNKNNGTCYDCYQFVIKRLIEIAETRINTGFFKQLDLFHLNRPRWFAGQIIEYPVHVIHLVDDAVHALLEYFERDVRHFCGHEIVGFDGTQYDSVVVGTEITHDADGADVRERCEVLVDLTVHAGLRDLLTVDGVGIL